MPTSHVIRETQVKTMKYHYAPFRRVKIQTLTTPSADENVEQQELPSLLMGIQNGATTLEMSIRKPTRDVCNRIDSSAVTEVPLWGGMLIVREATHGRGQEVHANSPSFLLNLAMNLKLA